MPSAPSPPRTSSVGVGSSRTVRSSRASTRVVDARAAPGRDSRRPPATDAVARDVHADRERGRGLLARRRDSATDPRPPRPRRAGRFRCRARASSGGSARPRACPCRRRRRRRACRARGGGCSGGIGDVAAHAAAVVGDHGHLAQRSVAAELQLHGLVRLSRRWRSTLAPISARPSAALAVGAVACRVAASATRPVATIARTRQTAVGGDGAHQLTASPPRIRDASIAARRIPGRCPSSLQNELRERPQRLDLAACRGRASRPARPSRRRAGRGCARAARAARPRRPASRAPPPSPRIFLPVEVQVLDLRGGLLVAEAPGVVVVEVLVRARPCRRCRAPASASRRCGISRGRRRSTQVTNGATSKFAMLLPPPAFLKPASTCGANTIHLSGDIQTGKKPSASSAATFTPAGLIAAV